MLLFLYTLLNKQAMKHTILITMMVLMGPELWSANRRETYQAPKKDTLTSLAISVGQHWYNGDQGIPFNLNLIVNRRWGGSLSIKKFEFRGLELPDDYHKEPSFFDFLFGNYDYPNDYLNTVSLMFGNYRFSRNNLLMVGVECGPSLVHLERANFKKKSNGYYDVSHSVYDALGAEFRVKASAPLSRYVGIETVGYANLNGLKSTYGLEINLCVGLLRAPYKPRTR